MKHPDIAKRWSDKYGSKVVGKTKRETIKKNIKKK
jgi:hypothetical protein